MTSGKPCTKFLIVGFNMTLSVNGTAYPTEYISDDGLVQNTVSMSDTEAALSQWVLIGMTILSVWLIALFALMITGKMDLVMMVVLVLLMFSILALLVLISMQLNASWVTRCDPNNWIIGWLCPILKLLAIAIGAVQWCLSIGLFTAICLIVTIFYMKAKTQ